MNKEFVLNLIIFKIKLVFINFHKEYIDFFEKIYSAYIDVSSFNEECYFDIELTQVDNYFKVNMDILDSEIQNIAELYNVIHYIVCTTICSYSNECKFVVLHASALCMNGKNILLLGVKSSGKTTTLLYLLKNGAEYLGDEVVVMSSKGIIPYQLPLRAKISTIEYLNNTYGYEFDYCQLPEKIYRKKQYLSEKNNYSVRKVENWLKCDNVLFLNEKSIQQEIISVKEYEAINKFLPCVRNKVSMPLVITLLNKVKCYSTDFSVSLEYLIEKISK